MTTTAQSESGAIRTLLVKHAQDAFRSAAAIAAEWEPLHFTAAPDFARAVEEYERFLSLVVPAGTELVPLPQADGVGLDSIYVRDASIVTDRGVILCSMGKRQRGGEPAAQGAAYRAAGIPLLGAIQPPGRVEGGDVACRRTHARGRRGYRTNDDGIAQLGALLGDRLNSSSCRWLTGGPGDVTLMSIISPVDRDLAVVYSPLMPVPFRSRCSNAASRSSRSRRGVRAWAPTSSRSPRRCVMVAGNPTTRARLERSGAPSWIRGPRDQPEGKAAETDLRRGRC